MFMSINTVLGICDKLGGEMDIIRLFIAMVLWKIQCTNHWQFVWPTT